MLWDPFEQYKYYIDDQCAYIISEASMNTLMPITSEDNWLSGTNFLINYFEKLQLPLKIIYASEQYARFIETHFPDQFTIESVRKFHDYIYSSEDLINLKGRKYEKKRNHINKFNKTYGDRFCFKPLKKSEFKNCQKMIGLWHLDKSTTEAGEDSYFKQHSLEDGIDNLLNNYDKLSYKIGGIYIDNILEAFSIGSYLLPDMAQIHVEIANPHIRGLYQILNKLFLEHNFSNTVYVNREDDVGVEGIRKAKLSYHPAHLIPKYLIYKD